MQEEVTSGMALSGMPLPSDGRAWIVPVGVPIGDFRVTGSEEGMLELRGNMTRAWRMIAIGFAASGLGLLLFLASFIGGRASCYAVITVVIGLMITWGGFASMTFFQRYDAATQTLRTRQFLVLWNKCGPGTYSHVLVHVTAQGKPAERVSVSLIALKSRADDLVVSDSLTRVADAVFLVMAGGQIARLLGVPIYRRGWASNGAAALTDALGLVPEKAA